MELKVVKNPILSLVLRLWTINNLQYINSTSFIFNILGGIADTVAKWVFRQGFSPIILNVAQYKNTTDSTEESVEMHNNLFLEEPEAATGLERILGKKLMWNFKL